MMLVLVLSMARLPIANEHSESVRGVQLTPPSSDRQTPPCAPATKIRCESFGSMAIEFNRPDDVPVPPPKVSGAGPSGVHVVVVGRFGADDSSALRCVNARGHRARICAMAACRAPAGIRVPGYAR